jgi:hypothetical protein
MRLGRLSAALLLSLLLVGMQLGSELHALQHIGEALSHTSDHSLVLPVDEPCPICTLFAGGANAAAGNADRATDATDAETLLSFAPASIATPAPSYYSSRAPPLLR